MAGQIYSQLQFRRFIVLFYFQIGNNSFWAQTFPFLVILSYEWFSRLFFWKASLSTLKTHSCDKLGYKHTTSTVTKMVVSGIKSRLLISSRARLNYAPPTTILHQPKYIHHYPPLTKIYPPPPTTSQNVSTTTLHQPNYIHDHQPPVKIYLPASTTT